MTKSKQQLFELGVDRVITFCTLNDIEPPIITIVPKSGWFFNVCAYYRQKEGIKICLEKCQVPCSESLNRNWTWPGNVIDREPYGVLAHELGHHCDVLEGIRCELDVYRYSSRVSTYIHQETGEEKKLTNYCENNAEWFAEMFRLFVTNPLLLKELRPRTYRSLRRRWKPLQSVSWLDELGPDVPQRIVMSVQSKLRIRYDQK